MTRQPPINKRHPGKHVVRLKVWMPDGSWLLLEGPVSKETAEGMVALGVSTQAAGAAKKSKP